MALERGKHGGSTHVHNAQAGMTCREIMLPPDAEQSGRISERDACDGETGAGRRGPLEGRQTTQHRSGERGGCRITRALTALHPR